MDDLGRAIGVVTLVGTAAIAASAGHLVRRAVLPGWRGPQAALAASVLALAVLVIGAEVAGVIGVFDRFGILVATAVVAGVGVVAARRRAPRGADHVAVDAESYPQEPRAAQAVAVLASAVVAVTWGSRAGLAFTTGIADSDSLTYHLPFAARFVETGRVTALHRIVPGDATAFHPANAELLHGLGIASLGTDVLSIAVNLGWLALALLAAWCIGRPLGRGSLAVAALCVPLTTHLAVRTQAGTAMTDTAALALLLAAAGLLLAGGGAGAGLHVTFVAAVAGGLAAGTKLTVLPAVVTLAVAAVVTGPRERRWRASAVWAVAGLATGSLWYVRNLVEVGSPVPALDVGIGPVRLPHPEMELIDRFGASVASYAGDGGVWRDVFFPGFADGLGPLWFALLAVAVGAPVLAVTRRDRRLLPLAIAGAVAVVAYLVTPTSAYGPRGDPVLFEENVRYLLPALATGVVLLAAAVPLRRATAWAAAAVAVVVAVTVADAGLLPTVSTGRPATSTAAGVAGALVVGAAVVVARLRPSPRVLGVAALSLFVLAVVAAPAVSRRYLETRYASSEAFGGRWARDIEDARIAVAGFFTQYELYGSDVSNHVQYVGRVGDDGSFHDIVTCDAWRAAVAGGNYDYVVVAPPFIGQTVAPPQAAWTRTDPGAVEVLRQGGLAIFELESPPTAPCR